MAAPSPRVRQLLVAVVALVLFGLWWSSQGPTPSAESPAAPQPTQTTTTPTPSAQPTQQSPTSRPTPTRTPSRTSTPSSAPTSSRDLVRYDDLPAEARTTIRLIEDGGPFPYDRDGITFGNFEGLLPPQPRGYYREYTVRTPGTNGRGARRIVTGKDGTMYYTSDHYQSFRRIEGP